MEKLLKVTAVIILLTGAVLHMILASLPILLAAFTDEGALVNETISFLEESYTEEEIKESLDMIPYQHVNVYYSEEEEDILPLTEETLDYAIEVNRNLLDYHPPEDDTLDLIFFENRGQMERFSNLRDISGFYSEQNQLIGLLPEEKEKLASEEEFSVYLYQRILIHEYTHYALHQKLREINVDPEEMPLWFHEGVAEWIANYEIELEPMDLSPVPFEKLMTDEDWQNSRFDYSTDIYLQSYYMINELVESFGEDILLSIINETKTNGDFNKAFQEATNESLKDFEKLFIQEYSTEGKTAQEMNLDAVS
ncbi:collagenase [Bacillus gobiensis]|uniref:collagenase n=1 Tax=Bacillus gobiensis TaxID=1441095 RepID=UPI003D223333